MHVPANERNYHIFYQVLAAAAAGNPWVAERYSVQENNGGSLTDTSFTILGGAAADSVTGLIQMHDFNGREVDEATRFEQTIESLEGSGFSKADIGTILDVIVGLLFLGNVEFEHADESE